MKPTSASLLRTAQLASLILALWIMPSALAQWSVASGTLTYGGGAGFHYDAGLYPPANFTYTGRAPTYIAYVFVRPDGTENTWTGPIGGSPGQSVSATATCTFDQYGTWRAEFWWLDNPSINTWTRSQQMSTYYFTISRPTHTLTINITGTGTGTITASPNGTTYSASTTIPYDAGTSVTLTEVPTGNSRWNGFNSAGARSNQTLVVTMDSDQVVTADFMAGQTAVSFGTTDRIKIYSGSPQAISILPSDSAAPYAVTYTDSHGTTYGPYAAIGRSAPTGPINAGTYAVAIAVTDTTNYTGSASDTLTIERAPITCNWPATTTFTYDGTAQTLSHSTTNEAAVTGSGSAQATDVGLYSYTYALNDAANYYFANASSQSWSITSKPITFSFSNLTQTYDGSPKSATVSPSDLNATYLVTYDGNSTAPTNAGNYTVVASATGNFQGSGSAPFSITPPPGVTASISTNPSSTSEPGTTTVYWSTANATSVSVSGPGLTSSDANGSQTIGGLAAGSYVYTITAQGYGGPVTQSATVTVSAPTVDASISASPATAYAPGSTTISWLSTNATSVSVSGPSLTTTTSASGSQTITGLAVGTYTYSIIAQGSGGPITRSVTVTITNPPTVAATIAATPSSTTAPGSTTVTWSTSNATLVSVTGPSFTTSTAASGSQTVSGLGVGTYTYTITAQGNGGPRTSTAIVTVAAPNVTASIGASPSSVTAPGATTITWSSANATSVSVSGPGMSTSTAASGSVAVSNLAAGNYTYTITAQGNGGPVSQSATVTVTASSGAVSATIAATPTSAGNPGSTRISWSSQNATSVSVTGQSVSSTAASGAANVSGLGYGSYVYTITVQGTGGPVTKQANFMVTGANGRNTSMSVNGSPVDWRGGTVEFRGDSNLSGSGYINIWRIEADGSQTYMTTVNINTPAGTDQYWGSWDVPATTRTSTVNYMAYQGGSDSYGGGAWGSFYQNPAPTPTTQTVTISPMTATVARGTVVNFTASGSATGYVWSGTTNSTGGTATLQIPSNATGGTTYPVTVYGPAAVASGINYAQSNIATATVSVQQTTPTITWSTPVAIAYGTPLSATQLNATANTAGTFVYSPAAGTVPPAGNVTLGVTFTPSDGASWTSATASVTLAVNKATLTVVPDSKTRVFGYSNPALTLSYTGFVNGDSSAAVSIAPSLSTTATTTSDVGSYPISASGGSASNYSFSYSTGTLTITAKPVTFTVPSSTTATYDETPKSVNVIPSDGAATYGVAYTGVSGPNYGPSIVAPSTPGDYTVAVMANGNYSGSGSGALTIVPATPTINWASPAAITYGTALSGAQLNATANIPGTFTYTPALGTVLAAGSQTLSVTFTPTDSTDYNSVSQSVAIIVNKAALTVTANDQTKIYGAANPSLTLSYSGFVNGDTAASLTAAPTATTVASPSSVVGNYAITPVGGLSANYTLSLVNGTLAVTPKPVTFAIDGGGTYDGSAKPVMVVPSDPNATYTTTYTGANGTAYPTSSTAPTGAGTYTVTVTANGNFSGTSTATITIAKASLTVTWGTPAPITYGTALSGIQLNATASAPGVFRYSPSAGAMLNTGAQNLTVTFTPTDTADYNAANGSVTLMVNKAALTVTAMNASRSYGTANPSFSAVYNGFVNGDTAAVISGAPSFSTLATTASSAGTYDIIPSVGTLSAANYSFTSFVSGSLVITRTQLTATANNQTKRYGSANPPFTISYSGFVNGDGVDSITPPTAATAATSTSNVGTYTIALSGGAATNYTILLVSGTLTVTQAPLIITADDQTRAYGAANPPLTISYSGFVNGDTASSISPPTANTVAMPATAVGSYAITLSGGSAANYSLALVNGTLTITPATLTVTANNQSRTYGDSNPTLTYTYSGFINGDTAAAISGAPAVATIAAPSSNVGAYPIVSSAGTLVSVNYQFAFANGTLTVIPKPVTFSFANLSYTYDGAVKTATAAPSDGAATYNADLTKGPNAGSYLVSAAATGNYTGTGTATLTIAAKAVTFTFGNLAQMYDGAMKTATVICSDPLATFTSDLTKGPNANTYAVSATANGNFAGSATDSLVISPATQIITLSPETATLFVGQPATFTAAGGQNAYVWGGNSGASGVAADVTLSFSAIGTYTLTVSNTSSGNYQQSNTATASIDVVSNHQVSSLTPIESSYTIHDTSSPLNGQTYGRIWQAGGWTAYLGRAGVRFGVKAQAWPSVKTIEIQAKKPGGDWAQLATQTPTETATAADVTFSVMLGSVAADQPLVPLSYQQGSPQTGQWLFRARVQDSAGTWSDFSSEVPVQVILPTTTKTVSGQTVPPAGELGNWFTASAVKSFSIQLWIP